MSQKEQKVIQVFLEAAYEERLRSILDEEKSSFLQAYLGRDAYEEYKEIAHKLKTILILILPKI